MDTHRQLDVRMEADHRARRVLVVVHGREPAGWCLDVSRALAASPGATVEVLAVVEAPSPPTASLLPAARRARARARADWRRLEAESVALGVEALLACLVERPGVTWVHVADADPGRAIVDRARAWPAADLIVVGVDRTNWLRRRLLGPIHERVVARAGCPVLVLPPPERTALGVTGDVPTTGPGGRPVAAQGGA